MNTGRFYAVGVGPGDPELVTLKAVRLIQSADVVYHAGPSDDQGRALGIIRKLLLPKQVLRIVLAESMHVVSDSDNGQEYYRAGVDQIAADCRRGLQVVFVTEGD